MVYNNHVVRHINPAVYQSPFMGQAANKIQKTNLEKTLKDLSVQAEDISREYNKAARCRDLLKNDITDRLVYSGDLLSSPSNLKVSEKKYKELEKQNEEIGKNPTYITLKAQFDKEKKKGFAGRCTYIFRSKSSRE